MMKHILLHIRAWIGTLCSSKQQTILIPSPLYPVTTCLLPSGPDQSQRATCVHESGIVQRIGVTCPLLADNKETVEFLRIDLPQTVTFYLHIRGTSLGDVSRIRIVLSGMHYRINTAFRAQKQFTVYFWESPNTPSSPLMYNPSLIS